MTTKAKLIQQNPLIMRCHRLMEVFAKSDDERDFYLDRQEGFLIYVDLDKSQAELDDLEKELKDNSERYCAIPKLTFYEIKKIMEGFVNEKIYDIDTKEKLIDIIQSKEARENFLEFIYDHHSELEKWQQYYQEKFRVRIIEWLRNNQFDFVFEEDLEMTKSMVEKLKMNTFTPKVGKDIVTARKLLVAKAKTYYSSEALNPRPKRGRPPKQVAKVETEPQFSLDIYMTAPKTLKPFLFTPDYHGSASIFTFSGKFASEADLLAHKRQQLQGIQIVDLQNVGQKLASLRTLSTQWMLTEKDHVKEPAETSFATKEPAKGKTSLNGEGRQGRHVDDFGIEDKSSRKREIKREKQAEESFFLSRKGKDQQAAPAKGSVKESSKDKYKPADKSADKKSKAGTAQKASSAKAASASKSAPKAAASSKTASARTPPKARLRPLVRKAAPKAPPKEKAPQKKKAAPLRLLRRSKKK